ncbi:stalk domain-containing protein [Domibacillus robiginosus]|uniref:stalk domain-containing protein n=1 Tax=Domibacillus robiginosus TaxID=1071054 RepID=UPI00067D22EF|nr:stalk domain-containing protein [Domibacillus robiginosus]
MFLLLLTAVCGILLTVQWIGYEKLSSASPKIIADQTIEIDVERSGFTVKQTLYSIPEETSLAMKLPADAKEVLCSKGDICITGSQSGTMTVQGKQASIYYKIPAALSSQSFLLNNWQASFDKITPAKTTLFITDHTKRGGQWISSIDQKAVKQLSEIDFYSFEGEAERPPLFWQKEPLKESRFSGVTVYARDTVQLRDGSMDLPFSSEELAPQTVVISSSIKPQQLEGLTFVKQPSELNTIRTNAIYTYVKKHFIFPKHEQWMTSVLAVSLFNAKPMYMKAAEMNKQITAVLTAKEEKEWKAALMELKGKEVNIDKLDETLSAVKGEQTHFFKENKNSHSPSGPLVFWDGRPVTVEDQPVNFHLKTKNGLLYIPLEDAAASLGFAVQNAAPQQWVMKKGAHIYQFDLSQNEVRLNGHPYPLYENALERIGDITYIDKIWFQKIFLVEVKESKKAIELKSYNL